MDPLSILSVAAAVVAFVDFGGKILRTASQRLREDDDLAPVLASLAQDAEQLNRLGHQIEKTYGYSEASSCFEESDITLAGLAKESILVSADVGGLISMLHTANDSRKGIALRLHLTKTSEYTLTKDRVREAQERLDRIKNHMMSAVIASLWANSKSTMEAIRKISLRLDSQDTDDASSSTGHPTQLEVSAEERERQNMIEQLWSQNLCPADGRSFPQPDAGSNTQVPSDESSVELERAVIGSLRFPEMEYRKVGISQAHEETFKWIFAQPETTNAGQTGPQSWSSFGSWLEGDDTSQVYLITGKPGSGKSTLMKYILESGRLDAHLGRWAKGGRLRTAAFYSWNAGSDGQRSERGFLRSILYQFLGHMPELISRACPQRWVMHRIFGTSWKVKLPHWTILELRQAFDILSTLIRRTDYKLALFIDGLDEFQVTDNFQSLLKFVETFRSQAGAKICVSSREWPVFIDYFYSQPSLRLQDLTRNDITLYIHGRFQKSVAYNELRDSNPSGVARLVDDILDKASGVFLWVRIVADVVLAGMESGETVTELHSSVIELPPDLSDLYHGIWNKLPTKDKINAARLFLILGEHHGPIDSTTMFAADQPESVEVLKTAKSALEKLVARRVRSQTKGLLEVTLEGNINYLHRTTKDWATKMHEEILDILPPDFDANLQLLKGKVAIATLLGSEYGRTRREHGSFWATVGDCLEYASRFVARPSQNQNVSMLVAALDNLDEWATSNQKYLYRQWDRRLQGRMPHWSSTQFGFDGSRNSFLGLTVQYSVLSYVQQKVKENPRLVKSKGPEISLLENALFIPGLLPSRPFSPDETPLLWKPRLMQRERLIRLLLDQGADPRWESQMLCKIGLVNVLTRPGQFGLSAKTIPLYKTIPRLSNIGNMSFWARVTTMFEEDLRRRGPMSRLRSIFSA